MKNVSFDFYWKKDDHNLDMIKRVIAGRKFLFVPDEIILDDDYAFEEGLKVFERLFDGNEDRSCIVTGALNGKSARLFLNSDEWSSSILFKIHIDLWIGGLDEFSSLDHFLHIPSLICCFIYNGEEEGRSEHAIGFRFVTASIMYFGDLFFKIISKESLLGIEGAKYVSLNGVDYLLIHLFDIFTDDRALIRDRHKLFEERTGMLNKVAFLHENFTGWNRALRSLGID
jgi:hypothetical protein